MIKLFLLFLHGVFGGFSHWKWEPEERLFRLWMHFGEEPNFENQIKFESSFRLKGFGIALNLGVRSIAITLQGLGFYTLKIRHRWFEPLLRPILRGANREFSLKFYEEYIWWQFWWNEDLDDLGNRQGLPWWRYLSLDWHQLIFGKITTQIVIEKISKVSVSFPEANYPVTIQRKRVTNRRPRWFSESFVSYMIDCAIPAPSKWGNDDKIYSTGFVCKSEAEAIGKLVGKVLESRLRYGGGVDWKPPV